MVKNYKTVTSKTTVEKKEKKLKKDVEIEVKPEVILNILNYSKALKVYKANENESIVVVQN